MNNYLSLICMYNNRNLIVIKRTNKVALLIFLYIYFFYFLEKENLFFFYALINMKKM